MRIHKLLLGSLMFFPLGMVGAQAESDFMEALTQGKVDFFLRYRYEHVNDAKSTAPIPQLEDADAQTLRTALGYQTGLFHGFAGYLQFEDVHAIVEDYNDGGANGKTKIATVVDPKGTELQQANLAYSGLHGTVFKVGRQEIEHRQFPLQRYVSNLSIRQNWQSFDAFRATHDALVDGSTGLPRLKLDYAYVWNVNRTFGEDNRLPDLADFHMASHLLRAEYDGIKFAKLEGYNYYLDFDSDVPSTRALSTNTFGMRAEGNYAIGSKWKLLYAAEYAHQYDIADNPVDINVNYYLGEGGASYRFGQKWLDTVMVKLSYEVLGGDGTVGTFNRAFQTPLATAHPFQGWADRFVTTPADGVDDLFVTLRASGILEATLVLMYHNFDANNLNYNYGTEWDALLERPFGKNLICGIKYAAYNASSNTLNVARNGASGQAFDLDKFWAYIQFKY